MFMPNKIKKSWNFKASYDFVKTKKNPKENATILRDVLCKLRPPTNYQLREIKSSQARSYRAESLRLKEQNLSRQQEKEDPFKITSYEGAFRKVDCPFILDQGISTPNSPQYDIVYTTAEDEDQEKEEIQDTNQSPYKNNNYFRVVNRSSKDLHSV